MAKYYASDYLYRHDTKRMGRSDSLPDADSTIEGGVCTWLLGTALTGARTITLASYDSGRHGEYFGHEKPVVLVKCAVDCSVNNAVIKDADGSTLFTFATDCSVTPKYVAFRLNQAGTAWELA